jgi:hypothetical protein
MKWHELRFHSSAILNADLRKALPAQQAVACWIAKKAPSRLVSNTTSQSAGFMRTAKPSRAIPGNGGHDGAKRLPCSCPILPGKTTRSRDREDSGYKRLAELFRRTSGKFRGLFYNNS